MSYPYPPDARAAEDFQLIRAFDNVDFEDHDVLNVAGSAVPAALELGEPVVYTSAVVGTATDPYAFQLGTTAGHIVGFNNNFRFAGWCWNKFGDDFTDYGSPSCLALGRVPIAQRGKHRVRLLASKYMYRPAQANDLRIKSTALAIAVGDDIVVVDCGAGVMAKYACLLPGDGFDLVATNPSTKRYKITTASVAPAQVNAVADADEVANIRINTCIVGKVTVVDGNYVEIEFN